MSRKLFFLRCGWVFMHDGSIYRAMNRTILWLLVGMGALVNGIVVVGFLYQAPREELTVSFLPIGQGDSIYIETPGGKDFLIDGGPDRSVLRELPKVMGPFDRVIDVVVATHPDKDHIAGLPGVFDRYRVNTYIESSVEADTSFAEGLEAAAQAEAGVVRVIAERGMRIHIEDGVYADILYPDRDVDDVDTNAGSVVLRLVYGETEFLFSGDAPTSIEEYLVALDGEGLQSEVLKAGHHGSRTSTAESWLHAVDPDYVVVSAGKNNSYGHPHEEVVERIQASGAQKLSTQAGEAITFYSDGKTVWVK